MSDTLHFEGAGDLDEWPRNVPSKPTQVAVFGLLPPEKRRVLQNALDRPVPGPPARDVLGREEGTGSRAQGKWYIASRVLWQHELTPEQAVEAARRKMQPQVDQAVAEFKRGGVPSITEVPGGLRPVRPGDGHGLLVEIEDLDNPGDPLSAWFPSGTPQAQAPRQMRAPRRGRRQTLKNGDRLLPGGRTPRRPRRR